MQNLTLDVAVINQENELLPLMKLSKRIEWDSTATS